MPINLVPAGKEEDAGIVVKHGSFDDKEYIVLHSVVSDEFVTKAQLASVKNGRSVAAEYNTSIIMSMVKDWRIKNGKGEQLPLTEPTVRRLSPQFKLWLVDQINMCDGSIDKEGSTTEISGVAVPFRKAVGSV